MLKAGLNATVLVLVLLGSSAAQAGNACATIMCLGGFQLGGRGGSECKGHIQDYFDIRKTKHGDFSPSRTCRAREDYLNECKEGSPVDKARIQAKYCMVDRSAGGLY